MSVSWRRGKLVATRLSSPKSEATSPLLWCLSGRGQVQGGDGFQIGEVFFSRLFQRGDEALDGDEGALAVEEI